MIKEKIAVMMLCNDVTVTDDWCADEMNTQYYWAMWTAKAVCYYGYMLCQHPHRGCALSELYNVWGKTDDWRSYRISTP